MRHSPYGAKRPVRRGSDDVIVDIVDETLPPKKKSLKVTCSGKEPLENRSSLLGSMFCKSHVLKISHSIAKKCSVTGNLKLYWRLVLVLICLLYEAITYISQEIIFYATRMIAML